jgi:hypothetical protein
LANEEPSAKVYIDIVGHVLNHWALSTMAEGPYYNRQENKNRQPLLHITDGRSAFLITVGLYCFSSSEYNNIDPICLLNINFKIFTKVSTNGITEVAKKVISQT